MLVNDYILPLPEHSIGDIALSLDNCDMFEVVPIKKDERLKITEWNKINGYATGFRIDCSKRKGLFPLTYIRNLQEDSNI